MHLILALMAAGCFTLGGVFMKHADGLRHIGPSLIFAALFAGGAVFQSYAMRDAAMSLTYVLVLGLEGVLAVGLGVAAFGEQLGPLKAAGVVLILIGIACIRGE